MLVRLDDIIGAPRPMSYVIRDGQLRVRVREGELGEVTDLSDAKKRAGIAVSAAVGERNREKSAQEKRAATVAARRKAVSKEALKANRAARLARKSRIASARKEKDAAAATARSSDKAGRVNAQLAHCVLALHIKRGKSVRGSWNICRSSLTKGGYMKGPYREDDKVDSVRATSKGVKRAMQHATEKHPLNGGIRGTPAAKFQKFRNIFKDIEKSA